LSYGLTHGTNVQPAAAEHTYKKKRDVKKIVNLKKEHLKKKTEVRVELGHEAQHASRRL
jgi:hypothetical protein